MSSGSSITLVNTDNVTRSVPAYSEEFEGLVDPRFWGVTLPNFHHTRPRR